MTVQREAKQQTIVTLYLEARNLAVPLNMFYGRLTPKQYNIYILHITNFKINKYAYTYIDI